MLPIPTNFPDVFIINEENPTLASPNSPYAIQFAQTRESLLDVETYKSFLESSIKQYRQSRGYKNYKKSLMELGFNRCQYHANIRTSSEEEEMATIEMHHHVLTIFDIALIIIEHLLNTYNCNITTFDLMYLLRQEHIEHRVCTVSLCKTCHQLYHNDPNFFLSPRMGIGNWFAFLCKYHNGITKDIAIKLTYLLKKDFEQSENNERNTLQLLNIRDNIINWSEYNECFFS